MGIHFTPVKSKRLFEEIAEQIQQLITGGELKPGDKLLSERELADRLQVSRVSVREAIRSLEMLGFIEIRHGEGTFIRDTNADEVIRPLAVFLAMERNSLLDMFEVRRIFETATSALAAERATDDEVDHIGMLLEKMKDKIRQGDSEGGEAYDAAYHYAVAEATHNSLLIKLLRTVHEEWSKAVSAGSQQLLGDSEENAQRIINQHTRVYEAIKAHDPDTASQAMLEHVTFAEREIRKRL
ncbi:MAG TPA: FadR/GntR family transcriptional regulator [Holophaga sp.]|nr:FadR/GntR family transcriptional regulator [Holophaga sp.]